MVRVTCCSLVWSLWDAVQAMDPHVTHKHKLTQFRGLRDQPSDQLFTWAVGNLDPRVPSPKSTFILSAQAQAHSSLCFQELKSCLAGSSLA